VDSAVPARACRCYASPVDETLTALLERLGTVARGGPGIVVVVTPQDDANHVVAIARGTFPLSDIDEVCAELRRLASPVPSPFVRKKK
jgi:hypothetical protein